MKKFKHLALAGIVYLGATGFAMAQQTVMKVASWIPPHYQNTIIFPKWKEMIEQATEGRVTLKLEYGLGSPASLFDLVEDGIADATWSFLAYQPGRFSAYTFAELPLRKPSTDGGASSELLWNVVHKHLKTDGEVLGFEGLHLGGIWVHPSNNIFMRKPITSLRDFKGKKIGSNGTVRLIGDAIGAVSADVNGANGYEKLQQGVADGSFFPNEVYKSLRLEEVAPYVVELDVGFGVFAYVFNKDFLASLSDKDRTAILAISGSVLSKMTGDIWQQQTDAVQQTIKTEHWIKSDTIKADFDNAVKDVAPTWLKVQPDNVKQAYEEFHSNVK